MARISASYIRATVIPLFVLVLLSMSLAGCGEEDACAGVSCDFGVCQEGACVNPNSCDIDNDCVPGYACGADNVCTAVSSCAANADCVSGRCVGGVCLNADTCESNDDCLPRTFCGDDNTCQPDPCNTYECEAGQCLRGTETCVSKDTCTEETEAQDCLGGDKCFEGSCHDRESFCETLTCERGTCDFETESCINASSCTEDTECVEGFICGDSGQCIEDLCVANNVTCDDGGVCVPSLGQCENADPCASTDECLAGHWCVDGTCRLEEVACGDSGCPGSQICVHDESALSVVCEESGNCQTSLGCKDDRQCAGGLCLAPMVCQEDRFEPNNGAEEAIDFFRYASALAVSSTVCSGDSDYFTFNSRSIPNAPLRGTLVVTAAYSPRDAGLGEIELEVIDPLGNSTTATSGPMGQEGKAQVKTTVNAAAHGQYTVRVADTGGMNLAGVSYVLSVDLLSDDYTELENSAIELLPDSPVSASIDDGTSFELGSTCTSPHNPSQENIYWFELTEPTRVTVRATPASSNPDLDLTLALRTDLELLSSEVACVDASDTGGEVLTKILAPGRYYIVSQVASGANGSYHLSMSYQSKMCAPAQNGCLDEVTAEQCNIDGTRLDSVSCSLGCDFRTGACLTTEGDTCEQALELNSSDFAETIAWGDYTNQIEMPSGSCVPGANGDTQTRGSEVFYEVVLEPGYGLAATLEFPIGEHGSLYVLEGCFNEQAACVAGANDGSSQVETLNYVNESAETTNVYLVADSAGTSQSTAEISVQIGEVICQPGAKMCDANGNVIECNGAGTAWQVIMDCRGFGCTTGQCDPQCTEGEILGCSTTMSSTLEYCDSNERIAQFTCPGGGCTAGSCDNPQGDVCLDAIPATNGMTHSGHFSSYSADYSHGSGACPGNIHSSSGPEAVYQVELQDGQTLTASASSSTNADLSVFIVTDCNNVGGSCLAGKDDGSDESVTYTNSTGGAQTVFVMIGLYSTYSSLGPFAVDFDITN